MQTVATGRRSRREAMHVVRGGAAARGDLLEREFEQLLGQARAALDTMEGPAPRRAEPRVRPTGAARPRRSRRDSLLFRVRNLYAALLLVLSVMPSLVWYHHRVAPRTPARPASLRRQAAPPAAPRTTPRRHVPTAPGAAPARAPAPAPAAREGRVGGIRYRYVERGDGIKVAFEPTPAGNFLALSAIVVAVIEETHGRGRLASLIPYLVPGENADWLKFKGRQADFFAAFDPVWDHPGKVDGCYIWLRPKD